MNCHTHSRHISTQRSLLSGTEEVQIRVRLLHAGSAARKEPMETQKNSPKTLQECEEKLKKLEEENQHLRESSSTFGQLAERLNTTLEKERRAAVGDRRQLPRPGGEQRHSNGTSLKMVGTSNDKD